MGEHEFVYGGEGGGSQNPKKVGAKPFLVEEWAGKVKFMGGGPTSKKPGNSEGPWRATELFLRAGEGSELHRRQMRATEACRLLSRNFYGVNA